MRAGDGFLDGVVHLKPAQQAGDRIRYTAGCGPASAKLPPRPRICLQCLTSTPRQTLSMKARPARSACPRLPPDLTQMRPQDAGTEGIQLSAQADHGNIAASVG